MHRSVLTALLVLCAAGCGSDHIQVRNTAGDLDHNREELEAAVATFVGSGRTLDGFRALTHEVDALRPGMDGRVAALAERTLVFLALDPIEHVGALGPTDQTARMASTVWPFVTRVSRIDGEATSGYVRRVCAGPYLDVCGQIAPDAQAAVLGNEVIAQLAQRARLAVASCEDCDTTAWTDATARWKELERKASLQRWRLHTDGALDQIPTPRVSTLAAPMPQR